jgi:5-methylcytosine-specific restriction protein A
VERGYCTVHQPQSTAAVSERARGSAAARGYDRKWSEYSRARLKRHPWCLDPDGRHPWQFVAAEHTDHVKPVSGPDDPLFWDENNHQSLCRSCHSFKTVREDGGFGRRG